MPAGSPWPILFQYDLQRSLEEEGRHLDQLTTGWRNGDPRIVKRELDYLGSIGYPCEYLVVERSAAQWLHGQWLPFTVDAEIGDFVIFRRQHQHIARFEEPPP